MTLPVQPSLWDRPPRARRRDPLSSHAAADRAEASGAIGRQAQRVLDALRATPGLTSAELAARHGIDRYAAARRLPELAARGLVRREEVGAREVKWWPARLVEGTDVR